MKVKGSKDKFAYLFVVVDSKNKILAVYVANSRTGKSARIVLQRARKNDNPEIIVTDGMQGYKKACKIFGRGVRHIVAHFEAKGIVYNKKILLLSNNRIERVNGDIDLFLHVFRGLKSFRTAEIWLQGFMIYHNYLKPSRISWHKIPKMITSRREVMPQIIFWICLSPFQLTESYLGTIAEKIKAIEQKNDSLNTEIKKINDKLIFTEERFKTIQDLSNVKAKVNIIEKRLFKK